MADNNLDGKPSEYDTAVKEYHASRARYIYTLTADAEKKLHEAVEKRRAPLSEEINNLTALAKMRYENRQQVLREYSAKAPGRVTASGLLPPSPAERMTPGIDRLYKTAVKASEEFAEVNEIIKKKKAQLEKIDNDMRDALEKHNSEIIAALESPRGLEGAFKRDPLLERAYNRMQAATARRNAVLESPPGAVGQVSAADG